jgi:hypothetical protein
MMIALTCTAQHCLPPSKIYQLNSLSPGLTESRSDKRHPLQNKKSPLLRVRDACRQFIVGMNICLIFNVREGEGILF